MQPDSIRPAASIPNIAFSDDMAQFQSKVFVVAQQTCARNATIPLIALSPKSPIIPELRCLSRVATGWLCLFCRNYCRFRLIFEQMR
jgi:hypothetical protein